jgi:hypothetical protein
VPNWLTILILIVLVILIFQNPSGSGHFVHQVITAALTFIGSI